MTRDPYDIRGLLPTAHPSELDPKCRQANNPFGHNPECSCRRPSQSVPYSSEEATHAQEI